jgi:hypothetical protein
MYGFNEELVIEGLIDHSLNQICVGKYDVQFHFSSGTFIAVQGGARIIEGGSAIATWTEEGAWSDLSFHKLLNHDVKGYSISDLKTLCINFDEDFALELFDDSDEYESMQIFPNGETNKIIVI